MECGDLSPLWHRRQNESGDKSPHSKRAVIELTKAGPEVTPTSSCTLLPELCLGFFASLRLSGECGVSCFHHKPAKAQRSF